MAIQIQGNGGVVAEVDGTAFRAQRITPRPLDHGSLGHYSATAASPAFCPPRSPPTARFSSFAGRTWRGWRDQRDQAQRDRLDHHVRRRRPGADRPGQIDRMDGCRHRRHRHHPGGAAQEAHRDGQHAGGGGRYPHCHHGGAWRGDQDARGAALAALAAAGPITGSLGGEIIAPGTILFRAEAGDGQHPLVLAQNEGFSIRSVAVPATGTWSAAVQVDWTEVAAF